MLKLRKQRPLSTPSLQQSEGEQSRTLTIATQTRPQLTASSSQPLASSSGSRTTPLPLPRTQTEQYWAARALASETLLDAREKHYKEMRGVLEGSEWRRKKELKDAERIHGERARRMENLIVALVAFLVLFSIITLYYLNSHPFRIPSQYKSGSSTWWPIGAASHFTIPILSPFASVVENDTSLIGTRTIMLVFVAPVLSALAVGMGGLWLHRRYPALLGSFWTSASPGSTAAPTSMIPGRNTSPLIGSAG